MSTNTSRLALDIGPWVWVYIVFQLCITLTLDGLWLSYPREPLPLMAGWLITVGASFTAQKVPLWRTLPVSNREIDRARWWQSVAAPTVWLCAACIGLALVMSAFGARRAAWPGIAMLVAAQSAVCVLIAGIIAIAVPYVAQRWGRWSLVLLILPILAIFRAGMPFENRGDLQTALLVVDVLGLVTFIALYRMTGHWPPPMTTTLWATPQKDIAPPPPANANASSLRGWPILIWGNLPTFAILWAVGAGTPLLVKLFLPRMDISFLGWMTCLAALQYSVTAAATGIRALRLLPMSGWELTCRLILFLITIQAVSLTIFKLVLLVTGQEYSPVIFLLPLAYALVYFPAVLRAGPRIAQFGLGLSILFIIPVQFLGQESETMPWIILGSLAVMAAGVAWTYWELTHGRHAYRAQPLVPARWRGTR